MIRFLYRVVLVLLVIAYLSWGSGASILVAAPFVVLLLSSYRMDIVEQLRRLDNNNADRAKSKQKKKKE